ncbi:MAG: amidohydrolase [Chloroflexi bacterium]|nr:amidohydrolase [Chloroflexota bacterium]
MHSLYKEALELFDYSQAIRRDFHQHPEIGFQEVRTAGVVAKELNELGLEVATGIAKTGVVAVLEGAKPGPVVLLRFDMDALPIEEETGAEYASQNPGVMHACGHDGHMAIGLTTAKLLQEHRDKLAGTVKFVFQPAEEGLGGAELMIEEGVLQNPKPDYSLALHLVNSVPLGVIGVSGEEVMAAAKAFKIVVEGVGGHGALPNLTVDPVAAAAHIITAVQTIVSRNVNPLEAGVVSFGLLRAGHAFNVIPSTVVMEGTMRSYKPEVESLLLTRLEEIVKGVAQSLGCQATFELTDVTPAVYNTPAVAERLQGITQAVLPEDQLDKDLRMMWSEDMAFMMQDAQSCYFFVGSMNEEAGLKYGHHHPKFDFDEQAMPRGAALMAAAAIDLLK